MKWIKCSERMPPRDEIVLGWNPKEERQCLCAFDSFDDPWTSYTACMDIDVITHWMPLPDKPETDG